MLVEACSQIHAAVELQKGAAHLYYKDTHAPAKKGLLRLL